jgi:hypothetical protein
MTELDVTTPEYEALLRAVEIMGSQTALADGLSKRMNRKIKQGHVWKWLNTGSKKLPPLYAKHVEALTKQKGQMIKACDLCPEAFTKAA